MVIAVVEREKLVGAGTDKSKIPLTEGPTVLLLRPQLAVNIGMCARAMANFGLSELRLVAPKEGWPQPKGLRKGAFAAASGAAYILESARSFENVHEAIADLNFVLATTARERGQGKPILWPQEAMVDVASRVAAHQKVGILFGPERTGLENDEIALADAIITFPVNPAYASLNLAQAVLLSAYEYRRAAGRVTIPEQPYKNAPPASREALLSFFAYLETHLQKSGFFRPDGKQPVMRRNLRNIFHRLALSEQDVRTLRGAVVRLIEGPRFRDLKPAPRADDFKPEPPEILDT